MTIDIVRLAREAGLGMMLKDDDMPHDMWEEELTHFAALVIEECALKLKGMRIHEKYALDKQWNSAIDNCAAAIRQMKGTT